MSTGDPLFFLLRHRIAEMALKAQLPTMFSQREYVEAGGLMSYGESLADFYRRAAFYVDKIFEGAKPADLPIQQPTRFFLVINRKTADAIGLSIPLSFVGGRRRDGQRRKPIIIDTPSQRVRSFNFNC